VRVGIAAVLVGLVAFGAPQSGSSNGTTQGAAPATDILLAFDTTGSMAPSIAAAKADAQTVLASVSQFTPNARFAVASFRDRFYPGGAYTLVTPMTTSDDSVVAALRTLKAVNTTDTTKDTPAEAYNLLFHQTYADQRIGWRPGARKIVVVIGDAEPHSAGAEGLAGCADRTSDWNGLSTTHELAAMRAAKRTLVMIRQAQTATVSLSCYATLASRAYEGGAARNGGSTDIVTPVLSLLKGSYAPLVVEPQLTYGVGGKTDGLTVRVANPNNFPLTIKGLSVKLPAGVTVVPGSQTGNLSQPLVAGGTISWALAAPLGAFRVLTGHVVLRLTSSARGSFVGDLTSTLPSGDDLKTRAAASLRVVGRPRTVSVSISGGKGATNFISGSFASPLGSNTLRGNRGRIVVRYAARSSVTLTPLSATASAEGAPTRLVFRVAVVGAESLAKCRRGATGTLRVLDSDALDARARTADRVVVSLPSGCGGSRAYADASAGGRTTAKVAFH
jgi:hypothetical protein